MSLWRDKHVRYFRRCLAAFPAQVQSEDANFLALVYFCLQGLDVVGEKLGDDERREIADFVYGNFFIENDDWQGFRLTAYLGHAQKYDLCFISATFFGLVILLLLEWDEYLRKITPDKIKRFVELCTDSDGQVLPALTRDLTVFGERDLRQSYMAAGIYTMIKQPVPSVYIQLVIDRVGFNGGLSSSIGSEPHLGFTFCGLAALSLAGYKFEGWQKTVDWLVHRQVDFGPLWGEYEYYLPEHRGLFNGRENKLGDTCYLWWCLGLLSILGSSNLIDREAAREFLLTKMQHSMFGGFSKDGEAVPDPLHSYLALAALSLLGEDGLEPINPELVVTTRVTSYLHTVNFN